MRIRITVSAFFFCILSCAPIPNHNLDWQVEIPNGEVQFVFLPANFDLNQNVLSTTNSEIEVYYKKSITNASGSYYTWNYYDFDKYDYATGTKIKIKVPAIKISKEIISRKRETLPDSLYLSKTDYSEINYEKLSRFFSSILTSKLTWLESIAIEKHCNMVLVSESSIKLDKSEDIIHNYIITIKAVIGKSIEVIKAN